MFKRYRRWIAAFLMLFAAGCLTDYHPDRYGLNGSLWATAVIMIVWAFVGSLGQAHRDYERSTYGRY